jgi:anaerobic selenocysteine-containing dehydrogenase
VRTRPLSILAEDGQGASWDPIKVEGEAPADSLAASEQTGTGATTTLKPGAGDPQDDPDEAATAIAASRESALAPAPDLQRWTPAPAPATPARDAYSVRLVVQRACYDGTRAVLETPILAELLRPARLAMSAHDMARLGVADGDEVKLTSARGSMTRQVVVDPAVPAAVAVMTITSIPEGPAPILDANEPVTDVRVETVR